MQNLRPEIVENHNLCSQVLIWLYSIDTPTGVCPSLHVAITSGVLSVGLRDKDLKPIWKILLIIYFIVMCYAVCAVKQHSVIDVFGGILLGIATELLVIILQRKTHAY